MTVWVSVPIAEVEMTWLKELDETWRLSRDGLYRQSGVELAMVTDSAWARWQLPEPRHAILTVTVSSTDRIDRVVAAGAQWERPMARQPWGAMAGFLRFPSGLLVEVTMASESSTTP